MVRRVVRDDAFLRRAMRDHGAAVLRLALAQTGTRADGYEQTPADRLQRGVGAKRRLRREKRRRAPTLWKP